MTRKLLTIFGVAFFCYGAWVYVWSVPENESNKANLILGGCESRDAAARDNWSSAQRTIPPFVRCVVRFLKKEQILSARFPYASVGTPDRPVRPNNSAMTPVEFYVHEGWREINFTSSSVEIDAAIDNVTLGSLDWLIANGADPNQCSLDGLVALHIAANHNRDDLFDKWVGFGANPDFMCPDDGYREVGETPSEWRKKVR